MFEPTRYPPSCAQFISAINNAGSEYAPQVFNVYGSQNTTAGLFEETLHDRICVLWTTYDYTLPFDPDHTLNYSEARIPDEIATSLLRQLPWIDQIVFFESRNMVT